MLILQYNNDKENFEVTEDVNNICRRIKNKDILKEVSHLKKNRPRVIVGFAAETRIETTTQTKLM